MEDGMVVIIWTVMDGKEMKWVWRSGMVVYKGGVVCGKETAQMHV